MRDSNPLEGLIFMSFGRICTTCGTVWNDEEEFDYCPFCDALVSGEKLNFGGRFLRK
ncbi:hypothetical protein [Methanonatronarchaeum sp. AMET-Sl]|uniref:hypothetical protein n=1 Tax=Methanonatronarchaeum sp. AMET-Sl TaxID=3037654 RepID=UPI00244E572E|nr:hypothetical protein [Methanonatronarchaeum sp. AMET-Sl]WGI17781.1 hypothetical protein QEN48_01885 [Methanonatronarchaeum sp. AMET-Sl]